MKLKNGRLKRLDNFDLEQAIMAAWGTCEDIDLVYERFYENYDEMSADDLANMLIGVKEIHQARCQKLWNIFENLTKQGVFKNEQRDETPFSKANAAYEGSD